MTRLRTTSIIAFILIACGSAWLVALPLWLVGGLANPLAGILIPVMMYTPTVAVLIVMLALRPVPRGDRLRFLGIWPLRPAKQVVWLSVIGLFGPVVLIAASIAVAAMCGWIQLDLVGLSGFSEVLVETLPAGVPVPPVHLVVVSQLIAIPFAAATINALLAFGEELGWRGFLVPALRPLGTWPALLISGVVWGLWHSPLILLGYNFGRIDLLGVLLMVVGCVSWGILLGWLRLRSASVWPAVFAHGAMNAAGGMVGLVFAAGTAVDPALAGMLGAAGWIVCAIVTAILALTGQFRRQPELDGAEVRLLSAGRLVRSDDSVEQTTT